MPEGCGTGPDALLRALDCHRQGDLPSAERLCRELLLARPGQPDALHLLGVMAHQRGDLQAALACLGKAAAVLPGNPELRSNAGAVCMAAGHWDEAVVHLEAALELAPSPERRAAFLQCLRVGRFTGCPPGVRQATLAALEGGWCRPVELTSACMDFLRSDPVLEGCLQRAVQAWPTRPAAEELFGPAGLGALDAEPLLLRLLGCTLAASLELEWFLTLARTALLERATGTAGTGLDFHCALARQCFLNEYVFAATDEELEHVATLRQRLEDALAAGRAIPGAWLAAVSTYGPLSALRNPRRLLERPWPEPVLALLVQQLLETAEEAHCRAAMPRLTPVQDEVSCRVRAQYEENPYPRWETAMAPERALDFDTFLHQALPRASFQALGPREGVDILVAGCGTGQHSIETARLIQGARMLAADLSLASLGYAQRKTREAGLEGIDYAQGDILELGSLGRTFDIIESVGVLHHLAEPVTGWKVLVSLLRPGGFMNVGLYSGLARRDIHALRSGLAQEGLRPVPADIRRCRQMLMTKENVLRFRSIVMSHDFYGTSPCRDLLFHVQEHCYSLPQIKSILQELGLVFLGFQLAPEVLQGYCERFPQDARAVELELWHQYEQENPLLFKGMYQFWTQKA